VSRRIDYDSKPRCREVKVEGGFAARGGQVCTCKRRLRWQPKALEQMESSNADEKGQNGGTRTFSRIESTCEGKDCWRRIMRLSHAQYRHRDAPSS
jgi:hypothetical protein